MFCNQTQLLSLVWIVHLLFIVVLLVQQFLSVFCFQDGKIARWTTKNVQSNHCFSPQALQLSLLSILAWTWTRAFSRTNNICSRSLESLCVQQYLSNCHFTLLHALLHLQFCFSLISPSYTSLVFFRWSCLTLGSCFFLLLLICPTEVNALTKSCQIHAAAAVSGSFIPKTRK